MAVIHNVANGYHIPCKDYFQRGFFSFLVCPFNISKDYVVTKILSIYLMGMRIIVKVAVDIIHWVLTMCLVFL